MVDVSDILSLLLSIPAVSAILTFKFILPVIAAALSINDLFMVVESDLNLDVILVESSNILALKPETLSPKALPAEDLTALILLDKVIVSAF